MERGRVLAYRQESAFCLVLRGFVYGDSLFGLLFGLAMTLEDHWCLVL